MRTYASVEQVLLTFGATQPDDPAALERIGHLLDVATSELHRELRRDYLRHPESADDEDEVWYATAAGTAVLHVHEGIVSLASVEEETPTGDWEEVDADDYILRGSDPYSDAPIIDGEPYHHVALTSGTFRSGARVRLTGVWGWPEPPPDLVEATIERARQLYSSDATFSGSPVGGDFGSPMVTVTRLPDALWRFLRAESHRFWCSL